LPLSPVGTLAAHQLQAIPLFTGTRAAQARSIPSGSGQPEALAHRSPGMHAPGHPCSHASARSLTGSLSVSTGFAPASTIGRSFSAGGPLASDTVPPTDAFWQPAW